MNAVSVQNVSKTYRLGQRQGREALSELLLGKSRGRNAAKSQVAEAKLFNALSDISLDVPVGEAVGLVGRNGAGKTTLLKILSRVTRPTSGRVVLRGRVGSLLEVGTGFHPELTGRENVFMSGSMLGMRKVEIQRKFDEIVEFAGTGRFLDTPVRRYSSGMYVRLAFAVAAHLEPEILLVDEVLAVGDVAFQRKCLGKMSSVARDGRTVIFVSHNTAAVQQLTTSAVLLEAGKVVATGPTDEVLTKYLNTIDSQAAGGSLEDARRPMQDLNGEVRFVAAELEGATARVFPADAPISFRIQVEAREPVAVFRFSFTIFRYDGTPVGSAFSREVEAPRPGEKAEYVMSVGSVGLAPGRYQVTMATGRGDSLTGHRDFDVVADVLPFEVGAPLAPDGAIGHWPHGWGAIRMEEPGVERIG